MNTIFRLLGAHHMHTPEFPFAECKTKYTYMLRKRGFFFALYKRQKTKKPSESLAIKTF